MAQKVRQTPLPPGQALRPRGGVLASAPRMWPWLLALALVAPDTATRVVLLTVGPGDRVWERFGHNALWVRSATVDVVYNYGLFDFHQPGFLGRFLRGRMRYAMAGLPTAPMLAQYAAANRRIVAQELALDPAQRARLLAFLRWNDTPEHRYYRYEYFRDNCSTRVRDALDRALGGQLRAQTAHLPAGTTYRFHSLRLTADDPLVYLGIAVGLSGYADRSLSRWEDMFIPMQMAMHMRAVRVRWADGTVHPLVVREWVVWPSTRPEPPAAPPRSLGWFVLGGVGLGVALAGLGLAAAHGRRGAAVGFRGLGGLWTVTGGLAGAVLLFLWAATDHVAAHRNVHLLLLPPFLLLWPWVRPRNAARLAAAAVALAALAPWVAVLPGWRQEIALVVALALPAHLGLAVGSAVQARRGAARPPSPAAAPDPALVPSPPAHG